MKRKNILKIICISSFLCVLNLTSCKFIFGDKDKTSSVSSERPSESSVLVSSSNKTSSLNSVSSIKSEKSVSSERSSSMRASSSSSKNSSSKVSSSERVSSSVKPSSSETKSTSSSESKVSSSSKEVISSSSEKISSSASQSSVEKVSSSSASSISSSSQSVSSIGSVSSVTSVSSVSSISSVGSSVSSESSSISSSSSEVVDDFWKDVEDSTNLSYLPFSGGYQVTASSEVTQEVVKIPSYFNGKPVIDIDESGFVNAVNMKKLYIPDTIKTIGMEAFCELTNLEEVRMSNAIVSLKEACFYGCENLTSVNITDLSAWCKIQFGDYNSNPLYYARNLYINDKLVTEAIITTALGITNQLNL